MTAILLAPYACHPEKSRGRLITEPASATRDDFQRDRDRILHSTAFRRLKFKTQVFLFHEGDHYRTRLTHSLEVAQVARSLARGLSLSEELAEALALAHDLGHPPFGHSGETVLDTLMADAGGFDHNAQSLRVVTELERRYAGFDGLNLTYEMIEGLAKHNGPIRSDTASKGGDTAIQKIIAAYDITGDSHGSMEAQVAAIADDIAYDTHDIDDALRAGFLTLGDLADIPIADRALTEVRKLYPTLEDMRTIHEVLRRILTWLIEDVFDETKRRIEAFNPVSPDAVRAAPEPIVAFSDEMARDEKLLKKALFEKVYRHPDIMETRAEANRVVEGLFAAYADDFTLLPAEYQSPTGPETKRMRGLCDYIAGMTDRFALSEYQRIVGESPLTLR